MPERERAFGWKDLLPLSARDLLAVMLLALIYAATAAAGLRWAVVPGAGTAFFPAAGVAVAALAIGGVRLWPGIVLGRILAGIVLGAPQPMWAQAAIAIGTTLAAVAPILPLQARRRNLELGTLKGMFWLVGAGAVGGAVISAAVGVAVLASAGLAPDRVAAAGMNWWLGYVAGVLTFAPAIMSWRPAGEPPLTTRQWLNLTASVVATAALGWLIFLRPDTDPVRAWFAFPGLVWAALALSVRGGSLAIVAMALAAITAAVYRIGPFADQATAQGQMLLTQQFVAIMAATTLLLAAATDERRQQERLRVSERRLREETEALEVLNSTGAAVAAELDLDAAVQLVTDAGVSLSGAKFGAFFYNVVDEAGEVFMLYALSGAPREAFEKFGHPRSTPIFAPTFAGEQFVRIDDVTTDPRYGQNPPHAGMPLGHLPVRSYLAAAVKSRSGEVIGGLFFGHPEPGVFTQRAERLIVGLASQAAIAIDNARLFQSAQRELAERRRAEERQHLLINELNHRVKNTLATVQSMGAQTLRTAGSLEQAREAFVSRLMALSSAHNLLTAQRWEGAELSDLVRQALSPFLNGHALEVSGPNVWLESSRALGMAMALHELGTNAAKYGALSVAGGQVSVTWTLDGEDVRMAWAEKGGPPVTTPERRGFGSRLIEQGLARELNGEVTLEFRPDGVRCELSFKLKPETPETPHPLGQAGTLEQSVS
jgi:two-component sensor histidine kinase/integral membrane sensor domain MASE1